MAGDPLALVYDFEAQLDRFGDEIDDGAGKVLRAAASTTAEAIISGNEYGDGIPVDTGFARSSFRVGLNQPGQGPTERPKEVLEASPLSKYLRTPSPVTSGAGRVRFTEIADLAPIGQAKLGDVIFVTSGAEYPQFLEFNPGTRRFGPNPGTSTVFLEPVEARFGAIVDDAGARVGYGR